MCTKDLLVKQILDHIVIHMMESIARIYIRLSLVVIILTALHKTTKLAFLIQDHYVQAQNKLITVSLAIHLIIVKLSMELLAATQIGLKEELETHYVILLMGRIA
jgi:hypothetical protein